MRTGHWRNHTIWRRSSATWRSVLAPDEKSSISADCDAVGPAKFDVGAHRYVGPPEMKPAVGHIGFGRTFGLSHGGSPRAVSRNRSSGKPAVFRVRAD